MTDTRTREARYPRVYAKVGTVPMMVFLRSKKPISVDDKIQYREYENGKWAYGIVTSISPLKFDKW